MRIKKLIFRSSLLYFRASIVYTLYLPFCMYIIIQDIILLYQNVLYHWASKRNCVICNMSGGRRARHPAAISITPTDKKNLLRKTISYTFCWRKKIGTRFQLSCLIINKRESLIVALVYNIAPYLIYLYLYYIQLYPLYLHLSYYYIPHTQSEIL